VHSSDMTTPQRMIGGRSTKQYAQGLKLVQSFSQQTA
jgi:hypothetical protein